MKRTEKTFFVQNLTEEIKSANSVVLVDYTGLTVKMQQELKRRLKVVGASMEVIKNSLLKIAAKEAKSPEEVLSDTVLSGPIATILSQGDPIAPIQVIAKFSKEFEIPQFKVGIIESKFHDKNSLIALSKLPGKDILYAQTIGTIAQPMHGLVGVLQANLQKLIYVLEQKSKTN